jgi:hypothetical protein
VHGQGNVRVCDDDLAPHLPRLGAGSLDDGVPAARVERRAVGAEAQRAAADLVPARAPLRRDLPAAPRAAAVGEAARAAPPRRMLVVVDCAVGAQGVRQAQRVHVARGEADGEDGLGWVEGLREEVGGQREGADGFEHFCGAN